MDLRRAKEESIKELRDEYIDVMHRIAKLNLSIEIDHNILEDEMKLLLEQKQIMEKYSDVLHERISLAVDTENEAFNKIFPKSDIRNRDLSGDDVSEAF